jgi:membrane fusion protein YbhG
MKPGTRAILIVLGAALLLGVTGSESKWFTGLWQRAPRLDVIVSGNIEAHESVLSFKHVQSRIVELPFDEGQWVNRGDLIARLSDADYRQNVEVARAALEQSRQQSSLAVANLDAARKAVLSDQADLKQKSVDFKRAQALYEARVVSTQLRDLAETAFKRSDAVWMRDKALTVAAERAVDAAQAAVRNAQENLKLSQIILGYTVLRAPFDGVILTRQAEVGEVMLPGTPVATLADIDHVWARAYINETDIGRVRLGQSVSVTTDTYPGKRYAGRVSAIASQAEFTPKSVETHAERVTLVYRIKIDLYNPTHELVPGMPVDAQISLAPSKSPSNSSSNSPSKSHG